MTVAGDLKRRSDLFQRVVDACHYILRSDSIAKETRDYIDARLSKEAQNRYGFGYFPSDSKLGFLSSLVDKDVLEELTLLYPKYVSGGAIDHGHFNHHNLIMPFRDVYGNIIALLGRTILPEEEQKELRLQKYKYSFRSNKDLYVFGLDIAKQAIIEKDCVIPVEGQFDCIACHEAGIKNVVATGWANLTRYQFFQLHRYTNNIYPMMDNDEAGRRASNKIKQKYSPYANIRRVPIPTDGKKDIEECLRTNDRKEREEIINWLRDIN